LGTVVTNQNLRRTFRRDRILVMLATVQSGTFCLSVCCLKKRKIRIYKVVILIVVLWSLTLREEHRLRVFENRLLRRIFRSKRDEVTGGWRKLHNEEFHIL
jgi:hypothetical protein